MAIARTQAVSANANTATLTSTAANDCILVFAYNNASTTIPSLPANYTSLSTNSATGNACRIGYRVSPGAETNCGTWTNATNVACMVYTGCNLVTPFLNTTTGAGNGATLTYTGFTMSDTSGRDVIAGFGGAKAATAGMGGILTGGPPTLAVRTNQTIINGVDSAGGVTSFTSNTLSVTGSGRWLTMTVEISNALAPASVTGGLSFSGNIDNFTNRTITAALSFIGNLATSHVFTRTLTAALSFIGTIRNQTQKLLEAALSYIGDLASQLIHSGGTAYTSSVSGGLSFAGSSNNATSRPLPAAISFVGSLPWRLSRASTAAISFIGARVNRTNKAQTGAFSFIGSRSSQIGKSHPGVLSFAGAKVSGTGKSLPGTVSFVGSFKKVSSAVFTAALSFVGASTRAVRYLLSAAALGLSAFFSAVKQGGPQTYFQNVVGGLSFSAAALHRISRFQSASVSLTGYLSRGFPRLLSAVVSFSGSLSESVVRMVVLVGSLGFLGSFTRFGSRILTSAVSFSGEVRTPIRQLIEAALSFIGDWASFKPTIRYMLLQGALSFRSKILYGFSTVYKIVVAFFVPQEIKITTEREQLTISIVLPGDIDS